MKFLNYDSPFMAFLRKLVDYMLVGILWVITCIPVFTYGAATTAALLTLEISIRKDGYGIWVTFWKWFRKDFKESTLLWLLWFPIQCIATANIWLVYQSQLAPWLQVVIYVATGFLFCWSQLWFGYLSKFDDRIPVVLGNTFRMILGSIGRAILIFLNLVIHIVAAVLLLLWMSPLLLLVPGSYLACYASLIGKLFAKYLPKSGEEESSEEIPDET